MAPTDSATQQHKIDPESLAALPRTSGVYIFRGEGTLPLYIGKSVDRYLGIEVDDALQISEQTKI